MHAEQSVWLWIFKPLRQEPPPPLKARKKACRRVVRSRLAKLAQQEPTTGAQAELGWLKARCRRCGRCGMSPRSDI